MLVWIDTTIPALIGEIDGIFDADATAIQMMPTVIGYMNRLRNVINNELNELDKTTFAVLRNRVPADIDSTAAPSDIKGLLGDLANYNRDNAKTVLQCVPAVGARTAGGTNAGSTTILVDMLDTWNLLDQNIQNQDFDVVCAKDSVTGGLTAHGEKFNILSAFCGVQTNIVNGMLPAADGAKFVGGGNRLQNPDGVASGTESTDTDIPFEHFTTNTPDKWTIDTGAAGVDVFEEAGAGNFYLGAKSMKLLGDGATLIEVSLDANDFYGSSSSDQKLEPLAHYAIGFYLKTDDVVGVMRGYMDGTAYAASATEIAEYDMGASGALAVFTLIEAVVKMPKTIPTDMKFLFKTSAAMAAGKIAYIDGAFMAKMDRIPAMGLNIKPVAGSAVPIAQPQDPDRWKFATTNTWAGNFQEWFARKTDTSSSLRIKYPSLQMAQPAGAAASAEWTEAKTT
jgi:hypothetical protein